MVLNSNEVEMKLILIHLGNTRPTGGDHGDDMIGWKQRRDPSFRPVPSAATLVNILPRPVYTCNFRMRIREETRPLVGVPQRIAPSHTSRLRMRVPQPFPKCLQRHEW